MCADAELETYFESAKPFAERRGAFAQLLARTFPIDGERTALAFVREFAAFLASCVEHGGCEVH